MTVNDGKDLRASRSLELLRKLHGTATDFARRENQVISDLRTRRFNAERRCNEALEKIDEQTAQKTGQLDAVIGQRLDKVNAVHDKRAARVQRFQHNATRDLTKLGQEARERFLGALQMKKYRAERWLSAGARASDSPMARAVVKLDSQKPALVQIGDDAKSAFRGYGSFSRMLKRRRKPDGAEVDAGALADDVAGHLKVAERGLLEFREQPLPKLFAVLPVWFPLLLCIALGIGGAAYFGGGVKDWIGIGSIALTLLVSVAIIYSIGASKGKALATDIASNLADARFKHEAGMAQAGGRWKDEFESQKAVHERTLVEVEREWARADQVEEDYKKQVQQKLRTNVPRALAKNDKLTRERIDEIEARRKVSVEKFTGEADAKKLVFTSARDTEVGALLAEEQKHWTEMEEVWRKELIPAYQAIDAMNASTAARFPAWSAKLVSDWQAPMEFTPSTKFAHIDLDLAANPDALPKDARLSLPGPPKVSVPLALSFPLEGSLLIEAADSGNATVLGTINNIILRLLSVTPPGKIAFTIIDPVGLGQSFAGLMHLGDYEETLINRRIWTQRDQIEERLQELNEHIEKVIQMYLRNEYATITEYNLQAGSVAEKYHFLVVADFPANFSDVAAKRLQSIASSGARCGVFTLIHWDERQPLPDGFVPDELRKSSIVIRKHKGEFIIGEDLYKAGARLVLDPPPGDELSVALVNKIGKASIDSNRVQVPFEHVAPKAGELWTSDTTTELRVAVGRTGATKLQYLAIGKGTKQHALFAGKTGSGKSTLFHVIITNLALSCSPDQVEFYLIDFKKGVEFKCYAEAKLPHARVIAIESDREFGLSVLQRVDDELKRRGDLFRKLGVQDIPGYKREGGAEPMPRSLLIIDEFQEFFIEDDAIAQGASLLFDRIVRQGRAFGIHVLLGSQTLGGAYTLARATLGQMVIRVALQCNEADAYLIMDENNPAPRLLSRPGEGIYNDSAGAIEGNSPFQVVWLGDEERDVWLDKVHQLAVERHDTHPSPIVFEGNSPSNIDENDLLRAALATRPEKAPHAGRIWLGAPNSIKGPTEAIFHRQSGNHLLIVGQREEAALTMVGVSVLALAAQYPKGTAKFVLIHGSNPGSSDEHFFDQVVKAMKQDITVSRGHDIVDVMNGVTADLKERLADGEAASKAPPVFVFIHGMQKFKKLRHEDDFSFGGGDDAPASAGAQMNDLISEGSSHGIHLILTIDTFNNINRFMSRKALTEFEMRVIFQMSQNDSASLIDSPKASTLGLHRALFYNEHEGYLETFRPYAMPEDAWISKAAQAL